MEKYEEHSKLVMQPQERLGIAIAKADLALLNDLLSDPAVDINSPTAKSLPLEWLKHSKIEEEDLVNVLELLLTKGADPLIENGVAIKTLLKRKKHSDLFIFLINHLITQQQWPHEIIIDDMPLIFTVIKYGDFQDIEFLLNICKKNNIVKVVLEQKYEHQTALFYALDLGNIPVANLLLQEDSTPYQTDQHETSVLHYIVRLNDSDFFNNFITLYDTDFLAVDDFGQTCLHEIAYFSSDKLIEHYLEKDDNCDVDKRDNNGNTPLLLALKQLKTLGKKYQPEDSVEDDIDFLEENEYAKKTKPLLVVAYHLLAKGTDVYLKNNENESALTIANELYELDEFQKVIKKHAKLIILKKNFLKVFTEIKQNLSIIENEILEQLTNIIESEEIIYQFIDKKIIDNAFPEKLNPSIKKLENIINLLLNAGYFDGRFITLYQLIYQLCYSHQKPELFYEKRLANQSIPNNSPNHYYTFVKINGENKLILLTPVNNNSPINYLITTLVYEAYQHDWKSEICQLHHKIILKIDPSCVNYTLQNYEKKLADIESEDYFGENLSDNSDSEQEEDYQKKPQRYKHWIEAQARQLFQKAQPQKLLTEEQELRKTLSSLKYDVKQRQMIDRENHMTPQVQQDLELLNMLVLQNRLNSETIDMITTNFLIAQYRGITYRIDHFNKSQRTQHRKTDEIGNPIFSKAVLALLSKNSSDNHTQHFFNRKNASSSNQQLISLADNLQDKLLQLKLSGPVSVKFTGKEIYTFDNALFALQDFYSKKYDDFHNLLAVFVKNFFDTHTSIDEIKDLIVLSINNEYSPFVSTADVPEHALRYAYGYKYYKNHEKKILKPRWHRDGEAERPYSGKVYISLHHPLELFAQSHHIVSLDFNGQIQINKTTVAERETTFFAYIPPEKVVSQYVAKFPSFKGNYKIIYLEKYGLTEELYLKFQAAIQSTKPHSKEREHYEALLTEHLISYQEVCLIEEARIAAEKSGSTLIYRSETGGFSLFPCQLVTGNNTKNETQKTVVDAKEQFISTNRTKRKSGASDDSDIFPASKRTKLAKNDSAESFLNNLIDEFHIYNVGNGLESLFKSLIFLLDIDAEKTESTIKRWQKKLDSFESPSFIEKTMLFLDDITKQYEVFIRLHSPIFEGHLKETGNQKHHCINIYYLGGIDFAALTARHFVNQLNLSP